MILKLIFTSWQAGNNTIWPFSPLNVPYEVIFDTLCVLVFFEISKHSGGRILLLYNST